MTGALRSLGRLSSNGFHPLLGYGLLLAVSYGALLAYSAPSHLWKAPEEPPHVQGQSGALPQAVAIPGGVLRAQPQSMKEATGVSVAGEDLSVPDGIATAAQVGGEDPMGAIRQVALDRIGAIGAQATSERSPEKRRAALARLGMHPMTDATVAAYYQALTSDSEVVNRVQAVTSLRQLARSRGDPDGRIRNLLSLAMQDAEPGVANAAQAAFVTLAQ